MKSIEIPYGHRANRRKNPRPSVTNFVGSFGAARSRRIIRRGSQTCGTQKSLQKMDGLWHFMAPQLCLLVNHKKIVISCYIPLNLTVHQVSCINFTIGAITLEEWMVYGYETNQNWGHYGVELLNMILSVARRIPKMNQQDLVTFYFETNPVGEMNI